MPDVEFSKDISQATARLRAASVLVATTIVGGTLGYYLIGRGLWSPLDCLYMTVITLTTVGYGEILPIGGNPAARAFTIVLVFTGMGVVLYFASTVTAFVLDGDLRRVMRDRKMRRRIAKMRNHIVLCGAGQTGQHVLTELIESKAMVVVIESNREKIEALQRRTEVDLHYLISDATEDETLLTAGVERAKAVIATLGNDHDNLLCTISARTLNPDTRIITRGSNHRSEEKFRRAGADNVIYTSIIGGMRIASEVLRPQVVTFFDVMLRDDERNLRIEQIELNEHSPVIAKPLRQAGLRDSANILVIAVYDRNTTQYDYNPRPDFVLEAHHTMIVLGDLDDIANVRKLLLP